MSILEILEAHQLNSRHLLCACGDDVSPVDGADWLMDEVYSLHRAHVAQVLEQHEREREAAVIAGLAELLDEYQSNHDVAECAAPVEGETGRQAVIEKWESIIEEPAEWLREQSKLHHERGFEHLRYVAFEAWQAGFESGWAEAKDPGAFVNDVWDAKTPNPYADEATS